MRDVSVSRESVVGSRSLGTGLNENLSLVESMIHHLVSIT